jgi:hypothetical protein
MMCMNIVYIVDCCVAPMQHVKTTMWVYQILGTAHQTNVQPQVAMRRVSRSTSHE